MDYFNSFFQNIKDKLSNPFFGTLILILIIHHWELWYSLFNFDSNYSRNAKVSVIRNLVDYELTKNNVFKDIGCAALITVLGYGIVIVTRALSMFIEFQIMPFITGKIISKNVVLKSIHDETVSERDGYAEKYEEQRKNVRLLSKNYDEQIEQIKTKDSELINTMASASALTRRYNSSERKLESTQNELEKLIIKVQQLEVETENQKNEIETFLDNLQEYGNLFFDEKNIPFWNSPNKFPTIIIDKVIELKKANKWEQFLDVANYLENGGSIASSRITEIKRFGVIKVVKGKKFKQLSAIAQIIFKYRSILEEVK